MCGIVGIVGRPPRELETIARMTATLDHRGPDASGTWTSEHAHLGHTRLSIIDLSEKAAQPMIGSPLVLTYNGEIYNFRDLRRGLAGEFRSDSDTEVLLRLLEEKDLACLPDLRGMFAFAAWDEGRRRLVAARDRLGIKPLYYRILDGGIAFASEAKALLVLGEPAVDMSALRDVLTYGYVPPPKSAWQGIHKLPPAHSLIWEDGQLTIERWWSPDPTVRITTMDEAVGRLDELLGEIVPLHTLSDVPVGVFLSGGIDSTTVAAFLDKPRTFTLGQDISRRSEAPAARRAAEFLGTDHHEEVAAKIDLNNALDQIPALFDEPFGDSGAWSAWLVSRLARRHVTVALSGEGGDELFCGYQWYSGLFERPASTVERLLTKVTPPISDFGRSLHRRGSSDLERYANFLTVFTTEQRRALLGPALADIEGDDLWHLRRHWREDLEPLKRMQWADLHTWLVALLTKIDRASMAHSLEVRPPLLDPRLIDFAFSLAPELQRDIAANRGKLVIRKLMRDRVPPGHFDRPKRGFNLPIRDWLRSHPRLLDDAVSRLVDAGLIRRPRVFHLKGEQAWTLLVLDRWLTRRGGL